LASRVPRHSGCPHMHVNDVVPSPLTRANHILP